MENLVGETVLHPEFGVGRILSVRGRVLTVCFDEGGRRFLYPDAFEDVLALKNPEKQKQMEEFCRQNRKWEEDTLRENYEREEREARLRNLKIHGSSQAVFDIPISETERILRAGQISTGFYESGHSRGQPRQAGRLLPGSVCLLTGLPEGEPEQRRLLLGVFMVREDFCGADSMDGWIPAHAEYRLTLSGAAPVLYHAFDEEKTVRSWGTVPFQYCSSLKMKRILRKIVDVLEKTEQSDLAKRFYGCYCERSHLSCDL